MKAVKANKEYYINEGEIQQYIEAAFDILGDDGAAIHYGRGKTVPYEEYAKVLEEKESLEKEGEGANKEVGEILLLFAHEKSIDLGRTSSLAGMAKKIKEHLEKGDA